MEGVGSDWTSSAGPAPESWFQNEGGDSRIALEGKSPLLNILSSFCFTQCMYLGISCPHEQLEVVQHCLCQLLLKHSKPLREGGHLSANLLKLSWSSVVLIHPALSQSAAAAE